MADYFGNFTIAPGQSVRHWYTYGFAGQGPKIGLAAPPSIATVSNRVVTVTQGIESSPDPNAPLTYTTDITCEDVFGTGGYGAYQFVVGYLP